MFKIYKLIRDFEEQMQQQKLISQKIFKLVLVLYNLSSGPLSVDLIGSLNKLSERTEDMLKGYEQESSRGEIMTPPSLVAPK